MRNSDKKIEFFIFKGEKKMLEIKNNFKGSKGNQKNFFEVLEVKEELGCLAKLGCVVDSNCVGRAQGCGIDI